MHNNDKTRGKVYLKDRFYEVKTIEGYIERAIMNISDQFERERERMIYKFKKKTSHLRSIRAVV